MRFQTAIVLGLLLPGFWFAPSFADYSAIDALGNANLVLEDQTTALSLFNLGNSAGIAFLPIENQLYLNWQTSQRVETEEFTTSSADANIIKTLVKSDLDAHGNTKNVYYLYFPNLDAKGNTLLPDTVYSSKRATLTNALLSPEGNPYQGVFVTPAERLKLQMIPIGSWQKVDSTGSNTESNTWQAGGMVRGAYQLLPSLALGAGVSGDQARFQQSKRIDQTLSSGVELGVAYRLPELFAPEDRLDLGLVLKGAQNKKESSADSLSLLSIPLVDRLTEQIRPVTAAFQGIYIYKSVMDVSLQLGYQYEDRFLSWENQEHLSYALRNLDYEIQFRVRLPMVREDDLRFGVSFNNHNVAHEFPTGRLELLDPNTDQLEPSILTASSGIGIGTAIVPDEGSIIALQYSLGSSKSRQENVEATLADTGYTLFSIGAQYRLLKGLFLRAAYVDQRITHESTYARNVQEETVQGSTVVAINPYRVDTLLTKIEYTRSFRFGIGIEDGPWQLSLSTVYDRVTFSPEGWNIPEKPFDQNTVNQDSNTYLKGMLSVSLSL